MKSKLIISFLLIVSVSQVFSGQNVEAIQARDSAIRENKYSKLKAEQVIANFYKYFNNSELDKLYSVVADDFEHQINFDGWVKGKDAFKKYIEDQKAHFVERIDQYDLMLDDSGRKGATKFIVKGKYIKTDSSGIPAKGQTYELDVVNYFEIKDGLLVKGRTYFDQKAFEEQVRK